jgi:demethylmenaquinone methyltransferase/2-methoxy-6-polyprenyl-1,4-benzoquinol methylase
MLATDRKLPVSGGAEKRTYVRGMFHAIAPSYDFLNHLLSANLDKRWRRKAIERLNWERVPDGRYLDLCAGTLDLAATLARQPGFRGLVVGSDFVPRMLRLGRGKAERIQAVAAEMSIPSWQPLRGMFWFYFSHILPNIGRLVSRHSNAYRWLPESVLAFPEPKALAARMTRAGFRDVSYTLLLGGICAVHVGTRA